MADNQLISDLKVKLRQCGFSGDVCDDLPERIINSTDNSIYELLPQCIIKPKNTADIQLLCKVAATPEFASFTFTARGGGTGTNGQALTSGLVVDTSRYMCGIVDFDSQNFTITVEPGVILSDLNQYLKSHNLFFAPNISTADRATIGGMIATDAAGKGSLVYGKTNDHVLELECVLADGTLLNVVPITMEQLAKSDSVPPYHAKLYQIAASINQLLKPLQNEIGKHFPTLKRPLSGYNIRQCVTETTIDLTKLIAGSEGTLAFITKAKLKLTPVLKYKQLVVIHYPSFLDAVSDAEFLIKHAPIAIETVDEKVQKSAQSMPIWSELAPLLGLAGNEFYVSNFVEFAENNLELLSGKVQKLSAELKQRQSKFSIISEAGQIAKLWSIRSLAVGLLTKMKGIKKPVAFVEDAIVPPANLFNFVKDFKALLDLRGLNYAMYGHIDVGCVHVRPALDLQDKNDRHQIRPITNAVVKLVDKYGGLLWGEHGKGFRGEFVRHVFGDELYLALQQIKALFDPLNKLNPGKLVTAYKSQAEVIQLDKVTLRGELDVKIPHLWQEEYTGAMLCNGNAACFNLDQANVMCPSYKVTHDRIHSPKGRSMLLKNWLRTRADNKSTKQEQKQAAQFVFEAMEGCLGCKGCVGKCPSGVSVPDLRSQFYAAYFKHYKIRTVSQMVLAYLESLLLWAGKLPDLWNFLVTKHLIPGFGLINIPVLSLKQAFRKTLFNQQVKQYVGIADATFLADKPVVIVADVFTSFLNHEVLLSSCKVIKKLGYTPYVLAPKTSGKAFLVNGMLEKFKVVANKLEQLLGSAFAHNVPVISLENSLTNMYRDDYAKYAIPLSGEVLSVAEFLFRHKERLVVNRKVASVNFCLLPHCTEQALMPNEANLWQAIFKQIGNELKVVNLGCCGMAGTYGHQRVNAENSRKLFNMHWATMLGVTSHQYLLTGYSCRSQVKYLKGQPSLHPIQVIADLLYKSTDD